MGCRVYMKKEGQEGQGYITVPAYGSSLAKKKVPFLKRKRKAFCRAFTSLPLDLLAATFIPAGPLRWPSSMPTRTWPHQRWQSLRQTPMPQLL
eukprot:scaffold171525_cov18-Tisochrysis_lutea.AAC.1